MSAERAILLCALSLALGGCGASALNGDAKTAPAPEEHYQTLDQASAAFERYAAELEGPYALNDASAAGGNAGPAAAAPSAAPAPPSVSVQAEPPSEASADRAPSSSTATREKEEAAPAAKDSCALPCRAFASMKRAGDAICRLDTPDGAHCKQAKQRIAAATDRLASCACAS